MKKLALIIGLILLLVPIALADATTSTRATVTDIATEGKGFAAPLYYDPSPAQPGQFVTLFIKVENRGGDEIKDALYRLEPEYPFSLKKGEDSDRYFGTIGARQQVLLEYDLYVDEEAVEGTHTVDLRLCVDRNCTKSLKKEIEITVLTGGIPGIEAGLEAADVFSGGIRGTVTLNIVNRGDLDVKYLVMELMPIEQYEIISPSRIYIGEMESDDFETAEFDIYFHENVALDASQRIQLPVFLEYTDANDKKYSESQSVYLKVYSQKDLTKMGLSADYNQTMQYVMLGIGALFVLFLAWRYYKKKQEEKS